MPESKREDDDVSQIQNSNFDDLTGYFVNRMVDGTRTTTFIKHVSQTWEHMRMALFVMSYQAGMRVILGLGDNCISSDFTGQDKGFWAKGKWAS